MQDQQRLLFFHLTGPRSVEPTFVSELYSRLATFPLPQMAAFVEVTSEGRSRSELLVFARTSHWS